MNQLDQYKQMYAAVKEQCKSLEQQCEELKDEKQSMQIQLDEQTRTIDKLKADLRAAQSPTKSITEKELRELLGKLFYGEINGIEKTKWQFQATLKEIAAMHGSIAGVNEKARNIEQMVIPTVNSLAKAASDIAASVEIKLSKEAEAAIKAKEISKSLQSALDKSADKTIQRIENATNNVSLPTKTAWSLLTILIVAIGFYTLIVNTNLSIWHNQFIADAAHRFAILAGVSVSLINLAPLICNRLKHWFFK